MNHLPRVFKEERGRDIRVFGPGAGGGGGGRWPGLVVLTFVPSEPVVGTLDPSGLKAPPPDRSGLLTGFSELTV